MLEFHHQFFLGQFAHHKSAQYVDKHYSLIVRISQELRVPYANVNNCENLMTKTIHYHLVDDNDIV